MQGCPNPGPGQENGTGNRTRGEGRKREVRKEEGGAEGKRMAGEEGEERGKGGRGKQREGEEERREEADQGGVWSRGSEDRMGPGGGSSDKLPRLCGLCLGTGGGRG